MKRIWTGMLIILLTAPLAALAAFANYQVYLEFMVRCGVTPKELTAAYWILFVFAASVIQRRS